MSLRPLAVHHNKSPRRAAGAPAVPTSDQELADARPSARERQTVKRLLVGLEKRLSPDALMFLACGAEDAARRKRAEEEGRGA